jgi:hypothetical protein
VLVRAVDFDSLTEVSVRLARARKEHHEALAAERQPNCFAVGSLQEPAKRASRFRAHIRQSGERFKNMRRPLTNSSGTPRPSEALSSLESWMLNQHVSCQISLISSLHPLLSAAPIPLARHVIADFNVCRRNRGQPDASYVQGAVL